MHHSTGSTRQVLCSTVTLLLSAQRALLQQPGDGAAATSMQQRRTGVRIPGEHQSAQHACAVLVKYWFCCPWINLAAWSEIARVRFGWQWPSDRVPIPAARRSMYGSDARRPSKAPQLVQAKPTVHPRAVCDASPQPKSRTFLPPMVQTHDPDAWSAIKSCTCRDMFVAKRRDIATTIQICPKHDRLIMTWLCTEPLATAGARCASIAALAPALCDCSSDASRPAGRAMADTRADLPRQFDR